MTFHDEYLDDAAEDLGGNQAANENERGSEEAGEMFEPLSSIVSRLLGRLSVDDE